MKGNTVNIHAHEDPDHGLVEGRLWGRRFLSGRGNSVCRQASPFLFQAAFSDGATAASHLLLQYSSELLSQPLVLSR